MIFIIWVTIKNYRNFIRTLNFKFQYYLLRLCIYRYNDNGLWPFDNLYLQQPFLRFFLRKYNILLGINVILILLLLTVTFFSLQKQWHFFKCSLKESQNFFIQSFPRYKVCLFSIWSYPQIVDIEYRQWICSPTFIVEDFSGLFARLSIFWLTIQCWRK